MRWKFPTKLAAHVAYTFLGGLLAIVAATLPVQAQPPVRLLTLPSSLAAPASAAPSIQPSDPRAAALAAQMRVVAQRLRASTSTSAVAQRQGRASAAGTAAAPAGRKPAIGAQNSGTARIPGAALRISADSTAFKISTRAGGSIRALVAGRRSTLEAAAGTGRGDDERTVRRFLSAQRGLLGLSQPERELHLHTRQTDRLGHRHLRFSQTFEGVPVFGAELIAQLDSAGNLITLNGAYTPTPRKLLTRPVVQQNQAAAIVRSRHSVSGIDQTGVPKLMVYLKDGVAPHLAWVFEVPIGILERRLVVVDAHTGSVLADFNQTESLNKSGSGIDLFGDAQPLNVWEAGGVDYLVDTTKSMYDASSSPPQVTTSHGVIVVEDAANQPPTNALNSLPALSTVTSTNATGPWLPDAVSATTNLSAVYDYFLTQHGRSSLDDQGGNLVAVVRLGQGFTNAFFDPSTNTMYFGDQEPYAGALDVVGHELTHGVVAHSAGLQGQAESGALNEAFADIFGEMVEARRIGQPDWRVGTLLSKPIRDLANPESLQSAFGRPFPARMSEYVLTSQDNGGVHVNSTIVSHAFYLLAQGLPNAIGIDHAADIFYRALTTKLTALSDFRDARLAAIQSAEELFGTDSEEAQRTADAFDAVEIFDTPTNPPPPSFPGNGGSDSTLFVYWDATASAYYLGRYEPSAGDALPGIQLSLNPAAKAKPSVSGDGAFGAFVNSQHDICFIETDGSSFEQCLGFPDTTHSVAMSPDGKTFAFVLLDAIGDPENTINVTDIDTGQTRTFALVAPTYDSAANIEVLAADTLDITADNRFLVYDAFNALTFADGSNLGLWSIYAIDLLTDNTLALVPPTIGTDGTPYDVGYPSIAQMSDVHITFDVLDSTAGQDWIVAADAVTGEISLVATSTDFAVPGYTGDDTGIVFSTPDSAVPTSFSLTRQALASDKVSPVGTPQTWLPDADHGVIYRRGKFTGPSQVDLRVSQSAVTQPGHRAVFTVEVTNPGPAPASNVKLADNLPAGSTVTGTQSNASCTVALSGNRVDCNLPSLLSGVTEPVQITVEAKNPGSLTNSLTAFASEPDRDPADNTSFSTVDGALLNIAPGVQAPISAQTAQVGNAFNLSVLGNFNDADSDTLTFSAPALPAGLSINPAAGTISGIPAPGTDRTVPYVIDVTAADAFGGQAMTTFSLSVNPAPPPPSSSSDSGGGGGGGGSVDWLSLLCLLWTGAVTLVRRTAAECIIEAEGVAAANKERSQP